MRLRRGSAAKLWRGSPALLARYETHALLLARRRAPPGRGTGSPPRTPWPPPSGTGPALAGWYPRRCSAPRQLELTAIPPGRAIPESGGTRAASCYLDCASGRACEYCSRPGHPAHRRKPTGVRARTRGGPGDFRRAGALPTGRVDRGDPGRRLDRQHQQDARAVRGRRRVPDPAATRGRRRRPGGRLARARGDRDGRLTLDARRRAADRGHGPWAAPLSRGSGSGQPGTGGRGRHCAAALPGPEDQAFPGGADVVPALAARPERRVSAAAHPGDRQGRT